MKIHEFQAKNIFSQYGNPISRGDVAKTPEEAKAIAEKLGGTVVVKAQIHAGGRGKGGGVRVASNPEDAYRAAQAIIGMKLVTHQTGPEGRRVRRVLVEQGLNIARELYLAMVLDRVQSRVTVICSSEGGVEIEEVAEKHPEKILKESTADKTASSVWNSLKQGMITESFITSVLRHLRKFRNIIKALRSGFKRKTPWLVRWVTPMDPGDGHVSPYR